MKIAVIFGPFSVSARPLNFFAQNIWISERGLSGSDLAVVMTAKELTARGHSVSLFTFLVPNTAPAQWEGVNLFDYNKRTEIIDDSYDALVSFNEPDVFRGLTTKPIRICQQMLNDFGYCQPGYLDYVDVWTSPSDAHKQWMQQQNPSVQWKTLSLGTDSTWFKHENKRPGSVIWLSSPDRGLHLLLQEWQQIKTIVPNANLKIFYHINNIPDSYSELSKRIKYIKYAIQELKSLDVEYVGSVSRQQIAHELSQAQVMIAPLSTIAPTEGFSVSTIEACAAGCLPIVGDIDCLGSIYGQVAAMIPAPVEQHLGELRMAVARGLTDPSWRQEIVNRCRTFADGYTWKHHVDQLEMMITEHPKYKNGSDIVKLNIGAGPNIFPHTGWINYDREDLSDYFIGLKSRSINTEPMQYVREIMRYLQDGNQLDLRVHDLRLGFPQHCDSSVDLIYVGQVIEHLNPIYEASKFLQECYRMLKPGGIIRLTTPDFNLLLQAYQNNQMDRFKHEQPDFYKNADPADQLCFIMFGATGYRCTFDHYEGHFHIYTRASMTALLTSIGFKSIVFYSESGTSQNATMQLEAVDQGMSHSFIVEASK